MVVGTESNSLLGSVNFNLNRERILLVKRKSWVYKIRITLVIALIFPLVLFRSNLEHLIYLGLHSLKSNSQPICVNTGQVTVRTPLAPTYHTSPTFSSTITIPSTQSFLTPLIPSVKLLGGANVNKFSYLLIILI